MQRKRTGGDVMAVETSGESRVRAWVLVQAGDPEGVAREFYEERGAAGGDAYVVVRADVIEEGNHPYNLVIPVDAATQGQLEDVVAQVAGRDVTQILILKVKPGGHNPYPPHVAHGYITEEELAARPELRDKERLEAGRQHSSPGHSPWG
jgi:hypothetical protein